MTVPPSVAAGSTFAIQWQGPNNPRDFITIVPVGKPEREYDAYVYTSAGNPASLAAPEVAGAYEVRYLTGQVYATLATAAVNGHAGLGDARRRRRRRRRAPSSR